MDVGLAVSQLDCLAVAPPGDPLADSAAREAREILEREGAEAYVRQLDALLDERASASGAGASGGRSREAAPTTSAGVPIDASPA